MLFLTVPPPLATAQSFTASQEVWLKLWSFNVPESVTNATLMAFGSSLSPQATRERREALKVEALIFSYVYPPKDMFLYELFWKKAGKKRLHYL